MSTKEPLIYLVACEPSADQLGAHLMAALRAETKNRVRFAGIGGARMSAAGLESLFDPRELALLGIFEVVPAFRRVLGRVRETLENISAHKPDVLVTIDSWGFTGRIHERLTKAGSTMPRLRYVAPQVWAWRPGRAKQLSRWIHHLLTLFEFEPPYFTRHGLTATWVGHPVLESGADKGEAAAFRARHKLGDKDLLLTVLPGSRRSEVSRLLPIFKETVGILAGRHGSLVVVIPTVAPVSDAVRQAAAEWPVPTVVVESAEIYDAFAASRAALSASGTVTLELAMAGVPHAIAYRVNRLSAYAFRRLTRTPFVNLVNVLVGRAAVPEMLQEDCDPVRLAAAMSSLIDDEDIRQRQKAAFMEVVARLVPVGETPSHLAAQIVLRMLNTRAQS